MKLKYGGSINHDQKTRLQQASTVTETSSIISNFITDDNFSLLSERGKKAITNLIQHDNQYENVQKHVYSNWPEHGIDDDGKRKLAEQVRTILHHSMTPVTYNLLYPIRRKRFEIIKLIGSEMKA